MDFNTPIEMPRATHFGNNYYVTYSSKLKRNVHLFSNLEYYNFLDLECDPNVVKFCEQPLQIDTILENRMKHAIFDVWTRYKDGSEEMQEVKYDSDLNGTDESSIRSQEQIRRKAHWCEENGIDFAVRTDKTLKKGRYYFQNLNVMAARLRRYIPFEEAYYNPSIINMLEKCKTTTIETLKDEGFLPTRNEMPHLFYLHSKGIISLNIADKPLDFRTEVTLCR